MARLQRINGQCILQDYEFSAWEIKPDTQWLAADGTVGRITLDMVDVHRETVWYTNQATGRSYEADLATFQAKYRPVVNHTEEVAHLLATNVAELQVPLSVH